MRPTLPLLTLLFGTAAQAHPHEFVTASLHFQVNAAFQITGIGVEWRYDPFTSMLILSDLDMDPAAQSLTPEEEGRLTGFDLNWIEGYDGDLWIWNGETQIRPAAPRAGEVRLDQGEIVSLHWRAIDPPLPADELVFQVYDPEYYIAYTLDQAFVEGPGTCRARVFVTDLGEAQARLDAMLDELYAGGVDPEEGFPLVGRSFADEVVIDCADAAP